MVIFWFEKSSLFQKSFIFELCKKLGVHDRSNCEAFLTYTVPSYVLHILRVRVGNRRLYKDGAHSLYHHSDMSDQGENFCQFDPSPAWRHAEHNIEILRGKVLDAVLKAEDGSPQIGQKGDYLSLWVSRPFRSPGKGIIRGCPDHCSNKGGVIRICGCKTTPGTTSDGDFVVKLDLEGEDRFGLSFLCSGGEVRVTNLIPFDLTLYCSLF